MFLAPHDVGFLVCCLVSMAAGRARRFCRIIAAMGGLAKRRIRHLWPGSRKGIGGEMVWWMGEAALPAPRPELTRAWPAGVAFTGRPVRDRGKR